MEDANAMNTADSGTAAGSAQPLEVPTVTGAPQPAASQGFHYRRPSSSRRPRATKPVDAPRCGALTSKGTPCPVRPMTGGTGPGEGLCRLHRAQVNPELAETVAAERVLGGKVATLRRLPPGFEPADLSSHGGLRKLLAETADAVRSGTISASQAQSVTAIVGAVIRLDEVEVSALISAIEKRLEDAGR